MEAMDPPDDDDVAMAATKFSVLVMVRWVGSLDKMRFGDSSSFADFSAISGILL